MWLRVSNIYPNTNSFVSRLSSTKYPKVNDIAPVLLQLRTLVVYTAYYELVIFFDYMSSSIVMMDFLNRLRESLE